MEAWFNSSGEHYPAPVGNIMPNVSENYINMNSSLIDKPIYRIMPIHRLLEVLEKKQLDLVKPIKWDDPFENFLLSRPWKTKSSSRIVTLRADVYGQCWTLHRETDAMWRIYSSDKQGIKVKTTPRKLLNALISNDPTYHSGRCFIGKVEYFGIKKLISAFNKIDLLVSNNLGIPKSLLLKRIEFSHEKEVRIIYSPDKTSASDIHHIRINPDDMFEQVVFDPRMNEELVCAYKLAIKKKGYPNEIKQSELYKPPKDIF
jgi:hypothetical protein